MTLNRSHYWHPCCAVFAAIGEKEVDELTRFVAIVRWMFSKVGCCQSVHPGSVHPIPSSAGGDRLKTVLKLGLPAWRRQELRFVRGKVCKPYSE